MPLATFVAVVSGVHIFHMSLSFSAFIGYPIDGTGRSHSFNCGAWPTKDRPENQKRVTKEGPTSRWKILPRRCKKTLNKGSWRHGQKCPKTSKTCGVKLQVATRKLPKHLQQLTCFGTAKPRSPLLAKILGVRQRSRLLWTHPFPKVNSELTSLNKHLTPPSCFFQ